MIRIPVDPYWENVKNTFLNVQREWPVWSDNMAIEMSVWLAQEYGCTMRGRKHLYFHFMNEYDADMFVLKFSGKS